LTARSLAIGQLRLRDLTLTVDNPRALLVFEGGAEQTKVKDGFARSAKTFLTVSM
jgi:hypothetical protein